jgi:hypothetical protein
MKHLDPVNSKAKRVVEYVDGALVSSEPAIVAAEGDVVALQQGGGGTGNSSGSGGNGVPQQPQPPHIPLGCTLMFSPGWEADRTGGTAGLCQPVERDLFDCHLGCYWPAQVPDQLNHSPNWTSKCAVAQKDWRKIDLVFP